ncbi:Uncharacterised protein [Mycobacterium tuberculosis]|nr:Uncharacterised protein [Mycobacterium tuberculosis]CKS58949.1 Uncharacterised protein [Mycobacterium tuberculosis]CKV54141.1 Uncharacterised protein [Mycobacterium tuberculosis]
MCIYTDIESRRVRSAGAIGGDHDCGQDHQHHGDDRPGEPGGLLYPGVVHRGQCHHHGDGHRVRLRGPHIEADRQRHRRTRCRLADHKAPARQVSPEVAQPHPAIHIGAPRGRVARGQPRRRDRIAVGHHRGHCQPEQQPRTGRVRGRGQGGKDSGTDHGPKPDHHRIQEPQPSPQLIWNIAWV